jgi:hypothetical protein
LTRTGHSFDSGNFAVVAKRLELPARRRDDLDLRLRRPHRRREADLPLDLLTQLAARRNPDATAPGVGSVRSIRRVPPPMKTSSRSDSSASRPSFRRTSSPATSISRASSRATARLGRNSAASFGRPS